VFIPCEGKFVVECSRIFIVGSGVVGTATGRGLADAGTR